MRASRVAATFWALGQVRAGGGANRRLTCLLLVKEGKRGRERERERLKLNKSCRSLVLSLFTFL